MQEASHLVRVLARVPGVFNAEPDTCHGILRELVNEHPRVDAILVSEPDGTVSCDSASPVRRGITVAGRDWFTQATAPDAPVTVESEPIVSRISGKLTLVVATSFHRAGAAGAGTISAGVNFSWFALVGDRLWDEHNAAVMVVSPNTRMVLSSSQAPYAAVGEVLPKSPLFGAIRQDRSGLFEGNGFDETKQICGFARFPGTSAAQAYVLLCRSHSSVVAPANRKLAISLGLLALVVVLITGSSIALATRLVMRPLRHLAMTAEALGRGELHARAPLIRMRGPEFRTLAQTLNRAAHQLELRQQELSTLATRDGLTGLTNRRQFDAVLSKAFAGQVGGIGLAMIDVDHFKAYNDLYGHPEGDMVLRLVAHALATTMRKTSDMVARYGGEEFVIMMPGLDQNGAPAVSGRLLAAVRALELPHQASQSGFLTVSVGLAVTVKGRHQTPAGLIQAADEALYEAKRSGRNSAVIRSLAADERSESREPRPLTSPQSYSPRPAKPVSR